jgi:hypothetical protein
MDTEKNYNNKTSLYSSSKQALAFKAKFFNPNKTNIAQIYQFANKHQVRYVCLIILDYYNFYLFVSNLIGMANSYLESISLLIDTLSIIIHSKHAYI